MSDMQKVAIVTGAGSGIGQDTAILLAESGYAVTLVGRTRTKLDATAKQIADDVDCPTLVFPADLTNPESPGEIAAATVKRFGRVDALCNVAGHAMLGPISEINAETWRRCIDTNLTAAVLLTAAIWPQFIKQKTGVVVNISSLASIDPFPGFSMYAAAKIGVNMFTKCTADEGERIGVRAVSIAPGAVETPMLRSLFSEEVFPSDKALDPSEVAALIRDCITGERAFAPGETITIAL